MQAYCVFNLGSRRSKCLQSEKVSHCWTRNISLGKKARLPTNVRLNNQSRRIAAILFWKFLPLGMVWLGLVGRDTQSSGKAGLYNT